MPLAEGPFPCPRPMAFIPQARSGREPVDRRFPRNPVGVPPMNRTHRRSAALFCIAAGFIASTFHESGLAKDEESRTGSVWVVNRDRGELVVFDAKTGTVLTTPGLPVGAGAHDICISEKAGTAYITAETINSVTTVDTRTLEINSIPVSPMPHHCEPSYDGRTIYVSLA